MPALKGVVAKLEDVDEKYRDLYTKTEDGKFIVQVEGVDDLPAVVGLKSKRDELLGKLKDITLKFDGVDPDEARKLKKDIEDLRKGGGNEAAKVAELESRIKQLTESSATEVKSAKDEASKHSSAAQRYFMRSEINRVLAENGGDPELLAHLLERQAKVDLVGDDYRLTVVDANGHARIKNAANEAMTLADLVPDLKKKHPGAFKATPAGGSGAGGSGGGGGGTDANGVKLIPRSNQAEINKHVREIASGKARVVDG